MVFSHNRWDTLWADGQIDWYAGDGSGAISQSSRVQAWIDQPDRLRVLIGAPGGSPQDMWVVDGASLRQYNNPPSPLPLDLATYQFYPPTEPDTIAMHPLAGFMNTPFSDMLFPTALGQRNGIYQVIGRETFAGREAVLLDWSYTPGAVADRFWIDLVTGVLLHWQNFGKGGLQGLNTEMRLNDLQVDIPLPPQAFVINQPLPAAFASGPEDLGQ
jgi:hypothetical protein